MWYDCNDVLMMKCVYMDVLWSMAWLRPRCAEECSHLCVSLTALVPTAPSRRAPAGPAAQVCLGFLAAERERALSVHAQISSMSARRHWLSMEREQGEIDGSLGGPWVMDDTAESRWVSFMWFRSCETYKRIEDIHLFSVSVASAPHTENVILKEADI